MMQDPVGADRAVRTKTRHDAAFARHGENTTKERERPQETVTTRKWGKQSRQQCAAQESNDNVHKQDVDMNNDNKDQQIPRKTRVTSLSAGTEKHKMMTGGKDCHPQPHVHITPQEFGNIGIMSTVVS